MSIEYIIVVYELFINAYGHWSIIISIKKRRTKKNYRYYTLNATRLTHSYTTIRPHGVYGLVLTKID